MDKIIRQFGEVRASNDDRKVKFIFSTNARDRHGTRINPDGWRLDNFNKNGIASYQHRAYGDPDPDMIIGKANAWKSDGRLVGTIDFETEDVNPLADKLYRKVKAGTLNAVSVGFIEHDGHVGDPDNGEEHGTYYFDDVELMEISLVTVPSNAEALAMREFEITDPYIKGGLVTDATRVPEFTEEIQTDLTKQVIKTDNMEKEEKKDLAPETSKVEVDVKIDATELNKAVDRLAETVKPKEDEPLPGPPAPDLTDSEKKELRKYSLRKAILQKAFPDDYGKLDGIEKEMHDEAVKESSGTGKSIMGLGIPSLQLRADLQTGASAAGGYLVQTDVINFIDALRNNMPSVRAGATVLTGLNGDVSIPTLATDSTATWRSEIGVSTQSDPAFGAVTMTPHRVTTYTTYSKQLLLQTSYDVENIVRNSLTYAVANALETAAMEGDGNSQVPEGILNASVNDATHGSTNPTAASWANIVNMETMVAVDNAIGARMAYIMKTTAAGKLKRTARDSVGGGYIWEGINSDGGAMVNGYPAYVSNVFTDDTVIFGNWAELFYGQWGGLDVTVNPYSLDTYAQIRVVIAGYYDVALAHAASFARIDDLVVT